MKRFYERHLLRFANKHPGHLIIAKRFLCPGWKNINANKIQRTNVANEFLILSMKQDTSLFYTINSEIGTCSYTVGILGVLCKH